MEHRLKVGVIANGDSKNDPVAAFVFCQGWPQAQSLRELLASSPDLVYALERAQGRWQLLRLDRPEWLPLFVDFSVHRFSEAGMRAVGRAHPLAKALGLGKGTARLTAPRVLDATAGLGSDAFVIAHLGCETVAMERNPVAYALLADGLARAPSSKAATRLKVVHGDATACMASLSPDVIYLDPMFPDDASRTALPKKGMQMFRSLIETDPKGEESLLRAALASMGARTIVKRRAGGASISGPTPDYACSGRTARFDVYFRK